MEVLLVAILAAILSAAAIPSFSRMVERAKVKDAQVMLNAIFEAERLYRLDQSVYGTVVASGPTAPGALVSGRYLANPNPHVDWTFAAGPVGTGFTATATRLGGSYNGNTVQLDERFTGASNPAYGNRVYDYDRTGTSTPHPLRD